MIGLGSGGSGGSGGSDPGCLVYSFGMNRETSFEYAMAAAGCRVYGYDHTVDHVSRSPQVTAAKNGLTTVSRKTKDLKGLKTLMQWNGHDSQTVINYMKAISSH